MRNLLCRPVRFEEEETGTARLLIHPFVVYQPGQVVLVKDRHEDPWVKAVIVGSAFSELIVRRVAKPAREARPA